MLAKLIKLVLLSLVAATGLITASASPAHALFYQVENGAPDTWWPDGRCSLREALYAIRWRSDTDDCPAGDADWNEIEIVGDPATTVQLTGSGIIEVSSFVTIYANWGPGFYQKINGNLTRFVVRPGGTLDLSGLHFANFNVPAFTVEAGVVPGYGFVRGALWFNFGEMSGNHQKAGVIIESGIPQTVGIWNVGGEVSLYMVKLHHNTGAIKGGAIYNNKGGHVTISDSSLYGNRVSQYGGAIHNVELGELSLFNVTISDNQADLKGGGIYLGDGGSTADLSWTTVNRNKAGTGGGINVEGGTFTTRTSIFSDNSPRDCAGTVTSANYNLFMNCDKVSGGSGDVKWKSANLSALTFPPINDYQWAKPPYNTPLWGSPAVDVIPVGSSCLDGSSDQIQNFRPTGSRCDIGSIERQ